MSALPPKTPSPPLAVPTPLSPRTAQQQPNNNSWQNQRLHQPLINTYNTISKASATLPTITNSTKQTATTDNNTNTMHILRQELHQQHNMANGPVIYSTQSPRLLIGSLSNNDGDGYENVTLKVELRCLKLCRDYCLRFNSPNVGCFFWS